MKNSNDKNIKRPAIFLFCFLLLFYYEMGICAIIEKTAGEYQFYRLTEDPADDRRPKLVVNDQGTVWVVWENDRDGDFDLYGKRFENGVWSDLFEITQDTNANFFVINF